MHAFDPMSVMATVPESDPNRTSFDLPPISGWGRFISADVERSFRLEGLRGERRSLYLVATAASAAFLVFALNDFWLVTGTPAVRLSLLLGRAVIVGLCAAVMLYAWRSREPIDGPLTVLAAVIVFSEILIATTRPAGFIGHVALELFAVLGLYLLVPIPFAHQAGLALAGTAGHLVVLLGFKHGVSAPTLLSLTFGFAVANLLGAAFSWHSNVSRRRAFAFGQRERELRRQLERAGAEVAALRQLLPICSSCKKVRDPAGSWHELDRYLAEQELARFTHGVCQACADRLYPELSSDDS